MITLGWLAPDYIPSNFFGTLADIIGIIGKTFPGVMKNLVLCVYAIHLSQAVLCLYICHTLDLDPPTSFAWFVQTLGLGMFALRFLIWPRTDHTCSQKTKNQDQTVTREKEDHNPMAERLDIDVETNCYICGVITHTLENCISYKWGEEMRVVLRYRGRCDQ